MRVRLLVKAWWPFSRGKEAEASPLAWRLFWSHTVLATILLVAVGITLSGLIGMNAMIAEVKNRYLTDFEEEEQVHRAAWAIETEARHGALACEQLTTDEAAVARKMREATSGLGKLLGRHADQVSSSLLHVAESYHEFGERVSQEDVCARLRDSDLDRERLGLDEQLTDAWISKLKELRLAILEKELAAQRLGTKTAAAGVGLGALALFAAALIARSMARGVTVPLSLLAGHSRRLGEGDFSKLPPIEGPYEVAQLSRELDRMRARLAEVNQLKQAFLGSVSHDLRTPLAHMREALSLLVDGTVGPLGPKQQRVAQLALRACEREIRLVSALLDLSRIRSGRPLMLTPEQKIDDIIENAIEHVAEVVERAGVPISADPQSPVPDLLLDSALVETALVNVFTNAIAVSPRGARVRVQRSVVPRGPEGLDWPGPWLRVVIEDEGPGVAAELHEKIFEPFFTKKVGPHGDGSGLGLPLAREMIRGHGGELALLSSTDQGAAFVIWLPIKDRAERSLTSSALAVAPER